VTPERTASAISWCLVGLAAVLSLYTLFAHWAVNAEWFGRRDMGSALFFAVTSAWSGIACLWLIPIALVAATAIKLTRSGVAWPSLAAAALGALPFVILG
jgi:hypothetical protein